MTTLHELFSEAVTLQQSGHHDRAARLYRLLLVHAPDLSVVLVNLALAEADSHNLSSALRLLDRALRTEPTLEEARAHRDIQLVRMKNLAIVHYNAQRIPEALQAIRTTIRFGDDTPQTRVVYARLLGEAGDLRGAAAEYDSLFAALKSPASEAGVPMLDPAAGPGMQSVWTDVLLLGWSCHLLLGDQDAADRYARKTPAFTLSSKPIWDGIPRPGTRILYALDMAFGDAFQFVRHAAILKALGMTTIVVCTPKLLRLLKSCPFIDQLVASGQPMPDHDAWLLSSRHSELVTALGDAGIVFPYIHAEPDLRMAWLTRLGRSRRLRIATNLSASTPLRDLPFSVLEELAGLDGVEILDITKSGSALAALRSGPLPPATTHIGDTIDNGPDAFVETAAILDAVDLVITTDTSIAHLAGAMGRPVWIFLRLMADCRWGTGDHVDSGYPTMRLYRQTVPGSWADVLYRMKRDLIPMIEARAGSSAPLPPYVPA